MHWEIDLTDANKAKLEKALQPFLDKARPDRETGRAAAKAGGRRVVRAAFPTHDDRPYNPLEVRQWADAQGMKTPSGGKWVGAKGKLSNELVAAYTEAHK